MKWFTIFLLISLQLFTINCYAVQIGNMKVPDDVYTSVHRWCNYYNVDTKLALALACQESSWNQNCKGEAGEVGVYQIMLSTVQIYNWDKGTQECLTRYKLDDNCRLGVWYLARKLKEFDGDWVKSVATYNCGSSNVKWWWEIDTTRVHVLKVMLYYSRLCGDKV